MPRDKGLLVKFILFFLKTANGEIYIFIEVRRNALLLIFYLTAIPRKRLTKLPEYTIIHGGVKKKTGTNTIVEKLKNSKFRYFAQTQRRMNLTIGSRSRRRVVVRVQVLGFCVKILCWVRILGRLGRVGTDFGFTTQSLTLRPWLIICDCEVLAHIWVQIWNLRKILGS